MNLFKPSTWFKATPQPIQINPGNAGVLARHVGRLINLYTAKGQTSAVKAEIKQRQKAIAAHGHAAPNNEAEARALLQKVLG